MENPIQISITFLGTGTSTGVPQIGCTCKVCRSGSPKDKRLRSSVYVSVGDTKLLIDCGPDFRQQAIGNHIAQLHAILLTHEHYDHIGGIDDVRPLGETHLYAEANVLESIQKTLWYCFSNSNYPGLPTISLNQIEATRPFSVNGIQIEPIRVWHGKLPIVGYRIGKMAYLTDVKTIEEHQIGQLQGLDVLIINALRNSEHFAHLTVAEATALAQKIGAKSTYFTHFSHDVGLHHEVQMQLPKGFFMAYDGLQLLL